VMSATFDVARLRTYFGGEEKCAVVEASGRPFRVREYFLEDIVTELSWQPPRGGGTGSHEGNGQRGERLPAGAWDDEDLNSKFSDPDGKHPQSTVDTVRQLDERSLQLHLVVAVLRWINSWEKPGGVLIFLPGWQEIAACAEVLKRDPELSCYEIIRLHSSVPPAEQQKALRPSRHGRRKAILSTDIAETSITIPDVICVVDSGIARVKMHTALEVMWASQANLIQRRGRAGRVQEGVCVHLFTQARFDKLPKEPTPEMCRVPLEEVVLAVCDLGLDSMASREDFRRDGACAGVWRFLKGALDPPKEKAVRSAFRELQHVGAVDDHGFVTHLGAVIARLPLPPNEGAAFFLAGLLGAPESASFVMAALSSREPWARTRARGEMDDGSVAVAAYFAKGPGGKDVFSDAFAAAHALCAFEQAQASGHRFCADRGLLLPVMLQMRDARCQLSRHLREAGCSEEAAPAGAEGEDATARLQRCWPLMQTMLTFAFGWNLGVLEGGGRKVQAGWSRTARLNRTSVLVDASPVTPLLTYAELGTGMGGRFLSCATAISEYQVLLFGGRDGPTWEAGQHQAVFEQWLGLRAKLATSAALGALRSTTRLVLQYAAQRTFERKAEGEVADHAADERLSEWRACVRTVAELPPPERVSAWECMPVVRAPLPPWALAAPAPPPVPPPPMAQELPVGWVQFADAAGRPYFACPHFNIPARWERPATYGPDGRAALWRWRSSSPAAADAAPCFVGPADTATGMMCFVRLDSQHSQFHHPSVGDGCVLPLGWQANWDPLSLRHYYWNRQADALTKWDFPSEPTPG